MDYIYIRSRTYGCYHMRIINKYKDKKSDEYKRWKLKKEQEYKNKVFLYLFNNFSEEIKKDLFEKYKTIEYIKRIYDRFHSNIGTCVNYKTLNL